MYGRHDVRSQSRDEDYFMGSEYFKNTKNTEPPVDYGDHLRVGLFYYYGRTKNVLIILRFMSVNVWC